MTEADSTIASEIIKTIGYYESDPRYTPVLNIALQIEKLWDEGHSSAARVLELELLNLCRNMPAKEVNHGVWDTVIRYARRMMLVQLGYDDTYGPNPDPLDKDLLDTARTRAVKELHSAIANAFVYENALRSRGVKQ